MKTQFISILLSLAIGIGIGYGLCLELSPQDVPITHFEQATSTLATDSGLNRETQEKLPAQSTQTTHSLTLLENENHSVSQFDQALADTLKNEMDYENEQKIASLIGTWSDEKPQDTLRWIESHGDLPEFEQYRFNVIQKMMQKDLASAMAVIDELPLGEAKEKLVIDLAYRLASQDQTLASGWANNLADAHLKKIASEQILSYWTTTDPSSAIANISRATDLTPDVRAQLAEESGKALGAINPKTFLSNLGQFPEDLKADIASGVVSQWVNMAPKEAEQWIQSLPLGEQRDKSVSAFANHATGDAIAQAFQLAESISEPAKKLQLMAQLFSQWKDRDIASAQAALQMSNGLNNEQKSLLLSCAALQ